MAWKKAILSRLFGSGEEEDSGKEETVLEEQEVKAEDALHKVNLNSTCLDLAPDHPVNKLWRLRRDQAGYLAAPMLRLEGFPEQPGILSESALGGELVRLRMLVTSTANERFSKAQPKEVKKSEPNADGNEETETIIPDLDAEAVAFTTKNELFAWIFVYPPAGQGRELSRDMLEQALQEKGITYGVRESALDSILEEPQRYFYLFPIAEGTAAIPGKDGYIVDRYPRSNKKELRVDESGHVDYSELHLVRNADEGAVICEIIPPVSAVPGRTVTDQEISARDGKAAAVPKGRNTVVTEDGTLLVAEKPGHVEFNGRNFQVKPVLEVRKNVDYSTGNINFLGDIHIHGDVCSGFTVRANGNITVDGVVEASSIEAGGDLTVVKGVKGDGRAVIHVHRSLYTKYLENTVVCVKEGLHTECIINCKVYSDGIVNADSGRGIIIGGEIHAANEVRANIVGSRSESVTSICLGGVPSDDFEYESLIREIGELQMELDNIESQPDNPLKARNLPMVRMKLSVDEAKLKMLTKELGKVEEKEDEGYRRLVCGTVYPGTDIKIGDASLHVAHMTRSCTAILTEEGEIRLQ